ncbi:MAG: 4Fe-4S binding protein [Terracidiphilus sp.]|jgi:polyferredoxin
MATEARILALARPEPRGILWSLLLTLPILLWSLLMFGNPNAHADRMSHIAGAITALFMTVLFFMMMRTHSTYRWRRIFFVSLGILFPIGFIHNLLVMRGSMGIPVEEMIAGRTPFCFMPIPMLILPAAFTRTLVFPGSIAGNSHGIAAMVALWLALTLVMGKGWCSYACFFGGIEEGVASIPTRAKIRKLDPRLRYVPWAVLLAMVLLSLALFEPAYCMWLCPFKAVTEYVAARNLLGLVQNIIFILLFAGLVVVLPFLTKKRTQCSWFCPFGAFQSIFNKISIFEMKIDQSRCHPCLLCQNACPNLSLSKESIARGETLLSCMKCGACVDVCPRQAMVWHIKGTQIAWKPERARLMFLYGAWALAIMFGGSIIAGSLATILHFVV